LAVSLIVLALAAPGSMAQQEARLGVVDMDKVLSEYKEFQASDADYKKFITERQQQLQERISVSLLTEDEMKEYQNLKAVTAPTPEQKQRQEQLRATAETREKEFNDLQSAAAPTDEQKKRLAELQALADKSSKEVQDLQKRLTDEANQRNKELSEKLNQRIETALAAVAKEKRVDFILAKSAVLYGGRDITADVLAKLNAGG